VQTRPSEVLQRSLTGVQTLISLKAQFLEHSRQTDPCQSLHPGSAGAAVLEGE